MNSCASLELDLARMKPDDAQEFMNEMNLSDSAFDRIVKACFNLLGLNVFFTVGKDECRAWPVKADASAFEAAGKIHSDIQRGFIRAMILPYNDFRSEPDVETFKTKAVQHKKEYIMQDGDIVEYRFNVA
jgi:ribosome-binding ATPase